MNLEHVLKVAEFSDELNKMPELALALNHYANAHQIWDYVESRVLRSLTEFLEKQALPLWEEFNDEILMELKGEEHYEAMEVLQYCDRHILEQLAYLASYQFMIEYATDEMLADYLAHKLLETKVDRSHYDKVFFDYKEIVLGFLKRYNDEVYNATTFAIWNYEDELTDELIFYTGSELEDYVKDDLALLAEIYYDEHSYIIYEGTLEELSEENQLYLRLNYR